MLRHILIYLIIIQIRPSFSSEYASPVSRYRCFSFVAPFVNHNVFVISARTLLFPYRLGFFIAYRLRYYCAALSASIFRLIRN
jgi:hypothetical protein